MNYISFILSLSILVSSNLCFGTAVNDTVTATRKFSVNLSSAFLNSSNWKGSSTSSFSTTVNSDFYLATTTEMAGLVFTVKSDLGFTKFIDSIWNKHSDKLYAQLIWKKKKYKIDQSYATSITAQLLNSYSYQYDPVLNTTSKTLSGTFFNPANFDVGYGIGISFWRNSIFNLSVASARIKIDPAENTSDIANSLRLGSVKHGTIFFDYGFSLQILVLKVWKEKFEVNSSSKFFIESFELSHLHMDMSHKINYSIWKWLQLRADIRMVYDPTTSMKMQYRNELLFGVFYEASKKFD
jgi:hypothetical protein